MGGCFGCRRCVDPKVWTTHGTIRYWVALRHRLGAALLSPGLWLRGGHADGSEVGTSNQSYRHRPVGRRPAGGAVGVARQRGALWFGTQADQTSLAPEIVAANQVYDWTVVLEPMIEMIQQGTMGGTAFALTLANGGLKITINAEALVGPTINAIIDGTIEL